MATGPTTQIADLIVPEIFAPYVQNITTEKSRLVQSGAIVVDPALSAKLSGGGLTFNAPSFKDLDNDEENISTDDPDDSYTGGNNNSQPKKTGTFQETAVRLNRNQSWSSADLARDLIGTDPMASIGGRVGGYWTRRLQAAFIATVKGVFADNAAAPAGTEHSQDDMTNDITGAAYSAGVTSFNAAAFLDTAVTMGDSAEALTMIMVHSIVFTQMQKNQLIKYELDATGKIQIPTYLGRAVIVDDGMPANAGVYESWLFGAGAVRMGAASPKVPVEVERKPGSGNGGGAEVLHNRIQWCLHPTGHKYVGSCPEGGPSNKATANNLAHMDSWERSFPERKQIPMARLITREHA